MIPPMFVYWKVEGEKTKQTITEEQQEKLNQNYSHYCPQYNLEIGLFRVVD